MSERIEFLTSPEERVHLGSRLIRWSLAIDLAKNNYFGRGYSYFDQVTDGGTPHNEILGQIVGVGFFGLLLVLAIYIVIYKQFQYISHYGENKHIELFKIILLYILIISIFENYSYAMYNRLHPLIWIIFGILSSIGYQIKYSTVVKS